MTTSADAGAPAPARLQARAYTVPSRLAAALLLGASRASLVAILVLVLVATDPPVTPPVLARLVALLAVVPGILAWLIEKAARADVEVRDAELVVRHRRVRLEVPCSAIAGVVPWALPLPGPGASLRMRSGRRLRYGIEVADPTPLLAALAGAGVTAAHAAIQHPTVVYAHARAHGTSWRWYHLLGKFVLFALLPTALLFNAHQHIAYGALLGEYYQLGLASYLATFAIYWATLSTYLLLYASAWRGLAEGVALAAARVAPSRAARVRRAVETWCRIVYYAGVPVLLLIRFLPW